MVYFINKVRSKLRIIFNFGILSDILGIFRFDAVIFLKIEN